MTYKSYINVPFEDKELAKKLGARWDNIKKSWYYWQNGEENDLERIAKWFPPRIEHKTEIVYVKYKTAAEILSYLNIQKEWLYRLSSKDKDLDGCIMVKFPTKEFASFFMDIYANPKYDLSSEEIRILEKWLQEYLSE